MSTMPPNELNPKPVAQVMPPNGTPGALIYICRHCHLEFAEPPGRMDGPGTLKAIVRSYGQLAEMPDDPVKLPLCQVHPCADGRFGIGDVVGMAAGTT